MSILRALVLPRKDLAHNDPEAETSTDDPDKLEHATRKHKTDHSDENANKSRGELNLLQS
jgi:hypothetical protein